MKIFLVIKEAYNADYQDGNDSTTISLGFTLADSIEDARERYPAVPHGGRRHHVLEPDDFFDFDVPAGL